MKTIAKSQLQEGSRIVLPKFDNGDEIVPSQRATVLDFQVGRDGKPTGMLTIEIHEADRAEDCDFWDDGLCEVHLNDLPARVAVWGQ